RSPASCGIVKILEILCASTKIGRLKKFRFCHNHLELSELHVAAATRPLKPLCGVPGQLAPTTRLGIPGSLKYHGSHKTSTGRGLGHRVGRGNDHFVEEPGVIRIVKAELVCAAGSDPICRGGTLS